MWSLTAANNKARNQMQKSALALFLLYPTGHTSSFNAETNFYFSHLTQNLNFLFWFSHYSPLLFPAMHVLKDPPLPAYCLLYQLERIVPGNKLKPSLESRWNSMNFQYPLKPEEEFPSNLVIWFWILVDDGNNNNKESIILPLTARCTLPAFEVFLSPPRLLLPKQNTAQWQTNQTCLLMGDRKGPVTSKARTPSPRALPSILSKLSYCWFFLLVQVAPAPSSPVGAGAQCFVTLVHYGGPVVFCANCEVEKKKISANTRDIR